MDSIMANDGVESSTESPEAEERLAVSKTKGRGLRRWRRIRREQQKQQRKAYYAYAAAGGSASSGRGDEDSPLQHKRRLPVPAGAPKAKHETVTVEEESSTASVVESRFVPQAPAKLDSGLGFLVESAGLSFSIGAESDDCDDRSSRSSTSTTACPHGKHPRAARSRADDGLEVHDAVGSTEPENTRSSVESGRRGSHASKSRHSGISVVAGNCVHQKGLSASADHSSERQPSEDLRSTAAAGDCNNDNGSSVLGISARRSADSDDDVLNAQNGVLHPGSDACAESVLLLQRTQEALENEIEKIVSLGEVPNDEFDRYDDKWGDSVHLEEPVQEGSGDSRAVELGVLGRIQPREPATEGTNTNMLLRQSELVVLYQEKTQAEIQCIILTRAWQTLPTPAADDQTAAVYEAQKSLSEHYRQLGLELRHAGNRAMALEKRAEKLQTRCEELSGSSELLQRLQRQASRASFFCFVQFVLLLCVAVATCLVRLVPSCTDEVVPT